MTRLAATNAYLAGDEIRKPPFPIHVVTQAVIAAGVALSCAWAATYFR